MLKIIAAVSANGVIGANGTMPWVLKGDLAHFRQLTEGHVVIMGRKTYEAIGHPLVNRTKVVLTRKGNIDDVITYHSLAEALEAYPDAFVIGGAEIYKQALPYADVMYMTFIDKEFAGDTFFPEYDENSFMKEDEKEHAENGIKYRFVTLRRV